MILTDEKTRAKNMESGVWGLATLDALFRKSAQLHPERLAIVDAPDRSEWTSGTPERLTYAEADHIIARISALFSHLGLAPDHVIGIMMPNTSAAVLTYLAAWRSGLIVAPIPLTWRSHSIRPALESIGAKAIITIDQLENEDFGTPIRDIAGDLFSIRQLLGFGDSLAEGIINIDQAISEIDAGEQFTEVNRKENAADHVATITFTGTADGMIVPVPRSHNQWIATGLMPLLEAPIEANSSILSPFMLTGLSGIGAGLVPWLLSGGCLYLHHFRRLDLFVERCETAKVQSVLCPAALVNAFCDRLENTNAKPDILAIWPGTHESTAPAAKDPSRIVDLTILDELALVARRRDDRPNPYPLPMGKIHAPFGSETALQLLEISSEKIESGPTSKKEKRELLVVRGPMAPAREVMRSFEFVPTTPKGFLETSILARITAAETRTAVPESRAGRLMMVGGLPLGANEVEDAYTSHEAVRASRLFVSGQNKLVPKLSLAVVPEHAAPFSPEEATDHANSAGLAEHARPNAVIRSVKLPELSEPEAEEEAPVRLLNIPDQGNQNTG